jgi:CheY-like chemotaxis protein
MDILLVDDHADTTRLLARLLTRQGHRVRQANDYVSALNTARADRADVLICDIGLNDDAGDGCDLLAEVLAMYPVKSIALTGYNSPEVKSRIHKAGFVGCLTKPVTFEELIVALDEIGTPVAPEKFSSLPSNPPAMRS